MSRSHGNPRRRIAPASGAQMDGCRRALLARLCSRELPCSMLRIARQIVSDERARPARGIRVEHNQPAGRGFCVKQTPCPEATIQRIRDVASAAFS
jgi:hypothetical protein